MYPIPDRDDSDHRPSISGAGSSGRRDRITPALSPRRSVSAARMTTTAPAELLKEQGHDDGAINARAGDGRHDQLKLRPKTSSYVNVSHDNCSSHGQCREGKVPSDAAEIAPFAPADSAAGPAVDDFDVLALFTAVDSPLSPPRDQLQSRPQPFISPGKDIARVREWANEERAAELQRRDVGQQHSSDDSGRLSIIAPLAFGEQPRAGQPRGRNARGKRLEDVRRAYNDAMEDEAKAKKEQAGCDDMDWVPSDGDTAAVAEDSGAADSLVSPITRRGNRVVATPGRSNAE